GGRGGGMRGRRSAPPKPPPTTTTRPPAPWATAGFARATNVEAAAADLRNSRRFVRLVMIGLRPQFFWAPYHAAIALTSSSEKPLAMRSITVDGRCPDLNAAIAAVMSAGVRPLKPRPPAPTPPPASLTPA